MFRYNAETHQGFWNDKLIPSITQLISLVYPMSENINDNVLAKASKRGTAIHEDIEKFNMGAIDKCETIEGQHYAKLIELLGLKIVDTEKQVLIRDENDNVIAYGTLDQVLIATKDTDFAEKGDIVLLDTKTVSQVENEKVEMQVNMYAFAYEIMEDKNINKLGCVWVRGEEIAQVRPLHKWESSKTYLTIEELVGKWYEQQMGQ